MWSSLPQQAEVKRRLEFEWEQAAGREEANTRVKDKDTGQDNVKIVESCSPMKKGDEQTNVCLSSLTKTFFHYYTFKIVVGKKKELIVYDLFLFKTWLIMLINIIYIYIYIYSMKKHAYQLKWCVLVKSPRISDLSDLKFSQFNWQRIKLSMK